MTRRTALVVALVWTVALALATHATAAPQGGEVDAAADSLWAGRTAVALSLLDQYLAAHPDDLRALRLRALALAWSGRLAESEAAYRSILSTHPEDRETLTGLAAVVNWRGRHREAARIFSALAGSGGGTLDVYRGLAYAYYWSGRPDLARAPLDTVLARAPRDREGLVLDGRINQAIGSGPSFGYSSATDSDGLHVRTATGEYRQALGRSDAVFLLGRLDNVDDGTIDSTLTRAGLGHERIWSDEWMTHAFVYVETSPGSGEVMGDAYAVFRPTERLRLDAGFARDRVLTGTALAFNIRQSTLALGLDWQPATRWRAGLVTRGSHLSDDNQSGYGSPRLQVAPVLARRVRVWTGLQGEYLTFERRAGHGYYDPTAYGAVSGTLDISVEPHPWWTLGTSGRAGWQHERGADWDPFGSISARVDALLSRSFAVGADVARGDSNLSSVSGYRRTIWSARLAIRF